MSKRMVIKYEDLLRESLKNKEFKNEYENLEDEFELAKEVISLRQKKRLTQKQLAEMIGTSQPAIARLESGSYRNISLAFIRKVAKALDAKTEIHLKKAQ
jgi:DNA-binding XRE family transcriptional regulator